MNKMILLGIAATLGAARLAFFPANPPVELQPASPGVAQAGHLNISGTATVGQLKSSNTVFGQSTAPTGFAYGGFFTAASNQARGFYGYASSPTGLTYGGFFQNASTTGRAVYGLATATTGNNYGGYFQTASSSGRGLLGVAASPTGTNYGVYGSSVSSSGTGVFGSASSTTGLTYGGYFQSASVGGRGLLGVATSPTGTSIGVYGQASSPTGYGVYSNGNTGVNGRLEVAAESMFNSSLTVFGKSTFNGKVGVGTSNPEAPLNVVGTSWFQGDTTPLPSTAGKGVGIGFSGSQGYIFGFDYGTFSPQNLVLQSPGGNVGIGVAPTGGKLHVEGGPISAVYGSSTSGFGVFAQSGSNHGIRASSTSGLGIYATSTSNAGGLLEGGYIGAQGTTTGSDVNRQAIRGENFGSPTGYAGVFTGNTGVFGTLTKTAGAFHIDHPLDPENKYLNHSFVESPDMKNIYDGTVITDSQGTALVLLPKYFDALNKDFRYQLTVIGQFAQAIVSQEIENNQFVIRTDKPNVKVSWQVTGIRHDPYAEQNRIQVEVDKPENFRGKYVYPAGYGKGQESSIAMAMPHATPKAEAKPRSAPIRPAPKQKN